MYIHPLIPLTLSLILGITWQETGGTMWPILLMLAVLYVVIIIKKKAPSSTAYIALLAVMFLAGSARHAQQQKSFENFCKITENKQCSVTATVEDIEASYRRPGQTIFILAIKELACKNQIIKNPGIKISVSTKTPQAVCVGDTISCSNLFFRKNENSDYKRYLIKENLGGHLYSKECFILQHRPHISLQRWLIEKRNSLIQSLSKKLSPTVFTLFLSIFWGKKQINASHIEPIKDFFKTWGLLHYLARSGLHLLIFLVMWNWIMGLLPLPYNLKTVILTLFVLGYFMLSWSSISFSRACIVFILYKLCILFDLQINALYLLTLTCSLILLYNPYQLFFLDFQLSFALTCALTLYSSLRIEGQTIDFSLPSSLQ